MLQEVFVFSKTLFKNPVLSLGILFMIIFILSLRGKGFLHSRTDKLKATSCSSILVMLNKRVPASWKTGCNDNNLQVTIRKELQPEQYKNMNDYKAALYRDLANDLMFISKNSPGDGLERVMMVTVDTVSPKMQIYAVTEGKYLARMATLNNPKMMTEHLKATVQVKEVIK